MRDSVPSGSYSSVCNVLRQWQSRSSLLIESTDSMIPATFDQLHYSCYINPTCLAVDGKNFADCRAKLRVKYTQRDLRLLLSLGHVIEEEGLEIIMYHT